MYDGYLFYKVRIENVSLVRISVLFYGNKRLIKSREKPDIPTINTSETKQENEIKSFKARKKGKEKRQKLPC